jgi:putative membrane protein
MGGTDAAPGMGVPGDDRVAGADGTRDPAASPGTILDNDPPAAGMSQSALSAADQQFIRRAAEASMYEVAVAKLAIEKANSDRIKSMANLLLDDHRRANDRLAQIAAGRMEMPAQIAPDKQGVIDRLSKASGAEFDRQFVQTVGIRDHQADIELFERAQREVQDPALKQFVQTTLPTLKHHLSSAQDLARTTGARP